ncbi:NADH-quinone oxidoreductase domain protein [Mycobacterium xenopi 4042]|uniref:NADH-quinone oxidoreductase domain protein n=1 Tax=Mycobacterium xenopi 4042 TaxID=1299334 RepID=X7Z4L5_MYCXE|nr:NADH-quinone oxidoreductase domain protein [Mycobacterium xenopi 4042]
MTLTFASGRTRLRNPSSCRRGSQGADHGQLLGSRVGAGGVAGRLRTRGRVADRVPAVAQGSPQTADAHLRDRPFTSRGLQKMSGRLVKTMPGCEASVLDELAGGEVGELLRKPGAVIMVGERLATVRGALTAAARLADATGARLAWVPRRAGERGALEAGALGGLLPGGRP